MRFDSFLGQSYTLPALQADAERSMNGYLEAVASEGGDPQQRYVFVRAPGLALLQTLPDSPARGSFSINGRAFCVAGGSFFELPTASTYILRGTIPKTGSPVIMKSNTIQICLIADGLGFVFTLATNVFTQITAAGFPAGAISLASLDTYFLTLAPGTNQVSFSALLDGLTWNGADFFGSQQQDFGVALAESHSYLWIFGQNSIVIFQDTGATTPFARIPGSQIEMGCGAEKSIAALDNTLFWLGSSTRGPAMVYRADGFLPTRVSHHALEAAMQGYPTTADATAYAYEENGHLFYRLDFPSANGGAGATWLYDVATRQWHERGWWNAGTLSYSADRSRYHLFCFGLHITFDYTSGAVYQQSLALADHAGNPLRWLRAAPHIEDGQRWVVYPCFELLMERGGGLASASSSSGNMLMNAQGLVVNAFNSVAGRGDYFHEASGTSEGQFLYTLGMFEAYKVTGSAAALANAELCLSTVLSVLYRGAAIPPTVDATHIFAPHWLFAVKSSFATAAIWYTDPFFFTGGVAVVPDTRGPVRHVFQATTVGAALLWQNPYSPVTSGTAYTVASAVYTAGIGTTVTLTAAITATLTVIYSTQSGPVITPGTPYEAWPDWRPLAAGEIDSACDTYNWGYRMFLDAAALLGGTWANAATATLQQAAIVYDVNDSRDWLKLSYSGSPFSDGSRFTFNSRSTPATLSCDAIGNVLAAIVAGAGETQYGNAAINDVYALGDSTSISIGASAAISVTVYIDPTSSYVAANRYACILSLAGTGLQSFTLTAASFLNPALQPIPAGMAVYTIGVSDVSAVSHTLTIGRTRQLPHAPITYYPGALPFTANFLGQPAQLIDWRGPAYCGYQSPWMWAQIGNTPAVVNSLQMLADAQTAWHAQTGQPGYGPFAPVFYFARADAMSYGMANTFGWNGPDPNTKWGGYQYRPLAEVAELIAIATGSESYYAQAVAIANTFLAFIDAAWVTVTAGPPSDYPMGAAQVNYPEPHFVALILRAALLLDGVARPTGGGVMNATYASLLSKAMAFWGYWWQSSGAMAGTFCTDLPNQTWFGFWHGEIMRTLSLLVAWARRNGQTATAATALGWLGGMISFASQAVGPAIAPNVYLRYSNDGGHTWSTPRAQSSGSAGQYSQRVRWLRLGRGRNRVFEVSGSDPIPQLVLMGAELS